MGVKPPVWFWIVALLLVLWEGYGVYMCVDQFQHGAHSAGWDPSPYGEALYAKLPVWYNYVYAIATFGGLLGALALVLKERRAAILFTISLIAALVNFGYLFAATDLIAHEGPAKSFPVPAMVVVVTLFAIWFSRLAAGKGWIGK